MDITKLYAILPRLGEYETILPSVFKRCGLDNDKRIAAFLAQCAHESAGMTVLEENLNYGAQGLANTWPARYAMKNADSSYVAGPEGKKLPNNVAKRVARNPAAIANNCYSSRNGNGTEASGDGWKFRGRGWKQVTFRANYAECSKFIFDGDENVLQQSPDMLTQQEFAPLSAGWFWQRNKLSALADHGTLSAYLEITKKINGGTIGHEHRVEWLNKICKAAGLPLWK